MQSILKGYPDLMSRLLGNVTLSKVGLKSLPKSQSQSLLKAQTPLDDGLQTRHGSGCTSAFLLVMVAASDC